MLKISNFYKKGLLKINSKFYNIFMNKNFFIIFVFILFTNNSLACDALKLTGTKVSSAKKTFSTVFEDIMAYKNSIWTQAVGTL